MLYILGIIVCLVGTSMCLPRGDAAKGYRAFTLPKTNYTFTGKPVSYSLIPLNELQDSYGHLKNLPSSKSASLKQRNVIGPDNRVLVNSVSFPYTAIGRLLWSDGTYCTATLVGDRVALTASHCVPWDNSATTMIFQPDFYDAERFGHANVVAANAVYQNLYDNFNSSACGIELDFAILKLDTVLSGTLGGFLGVSQWSAALANGLTHVGYPQDLASGNRPYQQTGIASSLDSSFQCNSVGPLVTTCDTSAGHSGGPLYVPSSNTIVGTFSAGSSSASVFASDSMASLVAWGRTNWPK